MYSNMECLPRICNGCVNPNPALVEPRLVEPFVLAASSICSEPTGREATDTLRASAALNLKKVDSGWLGWDFHLTSGATPTHNNPNECVGVAPISAGKP